MNKNIYNNNDLWSNHPVAAIYVTHLISKHITKFIIQYKSINYSSMYLDFL